MVFNIPRTTILWYGMVGLNSRKNALSSSSAKKRKSEVALDLRADVDGRPKPEQEALWSLVDRWCTGVVCGCGLVIMVLTSWWLVKG